MPSAALIAGGDREQGDDVGRAHAAILAAVLRGREKGPRSVAA
jgi:hypothetical protein